MNDKVNENLSTLMDNEWESSAELNELLAKLDSDSTVREKFERYHLVRDAMHREHSSLLDSGFASRVSAAIAEEPSIVAFAKEDKPSASKVTNIHSRHQGRQTTNISAEDPPSETAVQSESTQVVADISSHQDKRQEKNQHKNQDKNSSATSEQTRANWKMGVGGFALAASVALVSLLGLKTLQQPSAGSADQSVVADASGAATLNSGQTAGQNTIQGVLPAGDSNIAVGQQPVIKIPGNATGYEAPLEYVANTSTYWVIPNQKRSRVTETRLNMFLSQHIEHSPTADMGGMLPYSRLAGYDAVPAQSEQE